MKRVVILGSTGSIGQQTLDIARAFPKEFQVVGLAAGNNVELLAKQIREFQPGMACCAGGPERAENLPAEATFTQWRRWSRPLMWTW